MDDRPDTDQAQEERPEEEIKKPSVLSQVLPYLFAVGILVYVFTGLSSKVVDERHTLAGEQWSELEKVGVRGGSVEVSALAVELDYCAAGAEDESEGDCPAGGDFEFRPEAGNTVAAIRRIPGSRIGDGAEVSVDYVKKVQLSEIVAMVRAADLTWFVPLMFLHVLIFAMADVFSFGMAYRFFNVPGMAFREIMVVRLAPYLVQVVVAPLAEVFFPLYMWRVKKAPVTEIVSSNAWTLFMDTAAIFTVITPAVIYNVRTGLVSEVGTPWLIGCAVFWIASLTFVVMAHTSVRDWIWDRLYPDDDEIVGGARGLLRTFLLARWKQILPVYGVRIILWVSFVASNYAALRAVGVAPSPALAGIAIPLIVVSGFMPISVGGYGGAQLVAWFLLVEVGAAGTADQVLAYSFMWSTAFLIGRALIGMIFIRGFWKRCFPGGFSL